MDKAKNSVIEFISPFPAEDCCGEIASLHQPPSLFAFPFQSRLDVKFKVIDGETFSFEIRKLGKAYRSRKPNALLKVKLYVMNDNRTLVMVAKKIYYKWIAYYSIAIAIVLTIMTGGQAVTLLFPANIFFALVILTGFSIGIYRWWIYYSEKMLNKNINKVTEVLGYEAKITQE